MCSNLWAHWVLVRLIHMPHVLVQGPSFWSLSTLPRVRRPFPPSRNRFFQIIIIVLSLRIFNQNNSILPLFITKYLPTKEGQTTPRKFNKNNHDSNNNSIESIRYKFWIRPNTKTVTSPLLGTLQVWNLHLNKLHWMRILPIFNSSLLDWVIVEIEGSD